MPRSRSPSRNQLSPPQSAAESRAFHVSSALPHASLRVDEPGERVEQTVEIRRDMETEDLDVVADVSDHRELARVEHGREAAREASATATAREQDRFHTGTASSARVLGPSRASGRSRSESESMSISSSGIETVANGASSRNRRALPGP